MLLISHRSINLEKPTQLAVDNADEHLRKKLEPNKIDMDTITKLKKKVGLITEEKKPIHKHKKAKGPNPLSCKKSTKKKQNFSNNKNNQKSGAKNKQTNK